jgi:hypothetical protein
MLCALCSLDGTVSARQRLLVVASHYDAGVNGCMSHRLLTLVFPLLPGGEHCRPCRLRHRDRVSTGARSAHAGVASAGQSCVPGHLCRCAGGAQFAACQQLCTKMGQSRITVHAKPRYLVTDSCESCFPLYCLTSLVVMCAPLPSVADAVIVCVGGGGAALGVGAQVSIFKSQSNPSPFRSLVPFPNQLPVAWAKGPSCDWCPPLPSCPHHRVRCAPSWESCWRPRGWSSFDAITLPQSTLSLVELWCVV